MTEKNVNWYFDFISPFAYLQQETFRNLPEDIVIQPVPVLFAGLLNHWESKGPAEIPAKRIFTYRHSVWLGRKHNIPLRMPPAHPFNPLKALRLVTALNHDVEIIRAIFRFIWADGKSVDDDETWNELMNQLGVDNADSLCNQAEIKNRLRQNTEDAIAKSIFGVPTLEINGEIFWGFDATDMAIEYINKPDLFSDEEMLRIDSLPAAATR